IISKSTPDVISYREFWKFLQTALIDGRYGVWFFQIPLKRLLFLHVSYREFDSLKPPKVSQTLM
ncbi:hypothetical protein ACTGW8_13040, partial [Streptococcus suis]